MKLREIADVGQLIQGDPEAEVTGVCYDSRRVKPGSLFVAVPGFHDDGHRFVSESVQGGAAAVAVERLVPVPPGIGVLQVASARQALAQLACRHFQHPGQRLRVIGVTGTNGKTTTTHLIRTILMEQGQRVGLIGTVHNYIGDDVLPVHHTTPEAPELQRMMAQMVACGSRYAVMEVSSHALELQRVAGVEFDVGVFTNLTQDHLDFHGDFARYAAAKARLFADLGQDGTKPGRKMAVLNADQPAAAEYRQLCAVPVLTYGVEQAADVRGRDIKLRPEGASFLAVTPAGAAQVRMRLTGRFNVYNALAALATGLAEGCDLLTMVRALERTQGVAGRLEAVQAGQDFALYVDYAHTPDGLANVLTAAQGFCSRRLIVVFGAGGDRDPSKRPLMGEVVAQLADLAIVTSDNPRSEDPAQIIAQILDGLQPALAGHRAGEVIPDRSLAIERAVTVAAPGDVVVVAGKGHETYQIIGDRTLPFDDRVVARSHIVARLAREKGEGT